MAGPYRIITIPTKLTGAKTAAASILTDLTTLNASDTAYSTFGAANQLYLPTHYLKLALHTYRAWIRTAETADPNIDPTGAVTDIGLTGTVSLSETAGASRFVLTLTTIASTPATTLTSVTIDNTGGWLTPLGFEETTTAYLASGGIVTMTGDFQPRTLWPFPYSEDGGHDRKVKAGYLSNVGGNGAVYPYDAGGFMVRRDFRFVDLNTDYGAPRYPLGMFGSLNGARTIITLKSTDETTVSGLGGIYYPSTLTDYLAVGDWISVGGYEWVSRVKARDAGAGTITLWEALPASAATSLTAGDEVYWVSEAGALQLESERVGYLAIHDNDDVNQTPLWGKYGVYAPYHEGGPKEERSNRLSLADPFYSWEMPLVKRVLPELTLP